MMSMMCLDMANSSDLLLTMQQLINEEADDEAMMLQSWFNSRQHLTLLEPTVALIAAASVR